MSMLPPVPPPSPQEMFERAKKVVFYQDDILKTLTLQLYYHLKLRYLHRKLAYQAADNGQDYRTFLAKQKPKDLPPTISKNPIFITGKTGSGKTHVIKQLCQMFGVNFLSINSNQISNSGYKGNTLMDYGEILKTKACSLADEHPYFADQEIEFSVIFFDEFDKLFLDDEGANLHIYKRAMINELLTIFEGTSDFPIKENSSVPSANMLFILGGSFNLHQKEVKPSIGFIEQNKSVDLPTDQLKLGELGLPDELAGRISQILVMKALDGEMLKDILLNSPTSPYVAFSKRLMMEDCTAQIDETLLDMLLQQQKEAIDKFGVRGLYQGFNNLPQVQDVLLDAVSSPYHHYKIDVSGFTKEYRPPVAYHTIFEPDTPFDVVPSNHWAGGAVELPSQFVSQPTKPKQNYDYDEDNMPF